MGTGLGFVVGRFGDDNSAQNADNSLPHRPREAATGPCGGAMCIRTHTDMEIFWEAMGLLEWDFYGDSPPGQERSYGAIQGVRTLPLFRYGVLWLPTATKVFWKYGR